MANNTELSVSQPSQIIQPNTEASIGGVIQWAMQNGATVEQMRELYSFQREVKADQAREAFNRAFTAFKAEDIRIVKDKENTQYSKGDKKAMYASLEGMVATVTPYLSKHDLAAAWSTPAQSKDGMTVSCTLTHILGHTRTETVTGPIDTSGAKNSLQQLKSTTTYLKALTFESVCGLASAVANLSDDGNGAGVQRGMPDAELIPALELIRECDPTQLKDAYANAFRDARDKYKDTKAQQQIRAAYEQRKGAL